MKYWMRSGVDDMRLLIDRARTAILPDLPLAVQPAIFSTPVPTSNATRITSSTPKIDCVRSIASVRAKTTFTGSLDFLDSQLTFYINFCSNPTMLRLSQLGNNRCTTEDTEYFSDKLRAFCQHY